MITKRKENFIQGKGFAAYLGSDHSIDTPTTFSNNKFKFYIEDEVSAESVKEQVARQQRRRF